ncbi:hypothetical protein [Bacteroides sp.]|uniref:hypothetical protein n=1 Tax=Bacteroides sp. TaxID=29523 RepID=UPI0025836D00|nr:hypothetical protein [Bacteroides sp.]
MEKNIIAWSHNTRKEVFDDDYIIYEDGTIFHFYDKSKINYNIEEEVTADSISNKNKELLLSDAKKRGTYEKVKQILNL